MGLRLWVLVLLCCSCLTHLPAPYHYVQVGGASIVPLKEYHIWIDKTFGEADKLAMDDAIRQWNYALNGYVVLKVESMDFDMEPSIASKVLLGGGWIVMKIDHFNPMVREVDRPARPGEPQYYTLAWVNRIGGNRMWIIRDRMSNEAVEGVMLHELGHLLGAGHDQVYLMQPHYKWEDYRCVDYEAVKRVARYQHLPMDRLNYCLYEPSLHN